MIKVGRVRLTESEIDPSPFHALCATRLHNRTPSYGPDRGNASSFARRAHLYRNRNYLTCNVSGRDGACRGMYKAAQERSQTGYKYADASIAAKSRHSPWERWIARCLGSITGENPRVTKMLRGEP